MPQMSLPLNPSILQGLRPPGGGMGARPPMPQQGMQGANPFMGSQNPGAFAQPAPFNPLLALTLLGQRGGMMPPPGAGQGASGLLQRGPMGSFGLTPEKERPRSGGANPYR